MTATTAPHKLYRDHTVSLNDSMKFEVRGPVLERVHYQAFNTYADATEAIDKAVAAKARADTIKLNLAVIDRTGTRGIITGVHKSEGHVLIRGEANSGSDLYPDVPWLRYLVLEKEKLAKQMGDIETQIYPYSIRRSRAYHKLSAEGHAAALEKLRADYEEKNRKAFKKGEDK